jgi:hypothetical protein
LKRNGGNTNLATKPFFFCQSKQSGFVFLAPTKNSRLLIEWFIYFVANLLPFLRLKDAERMKQNNLINQMFPFRQSLEMFEYRKC